MDYYKVLGIEKSASDSEIKKAYHKMALKYHPDKVSTSDKETKETKEEYTKKFQEISEAYEVLSDPEKRKIYDTMGKEGLSNNFAGGFNGQNPFDIFNMFNNFNTSSFNFNSFTGNPFGRNTNKTEVKKTKDSSFKITLSLKDAYKGIKKKFKITRNIIVDKDGDKINDVENTWTTCQTCRGAGMFNEIKQMGNMITQVSRPCSSCVNGVILKPDYKVKEVTEVIEVEIPKGVVTNYQQMLKNMGNYSPGTLPGDLIILVTVEDNFQNYKREFPVSNNLVYKYDINLVDALCGCKISIKSLDDRDILVDITDIVVKPGTIKIIKGEGMTSNSDLKVHFNIVFPDKISNKTRKELRRILN